MYSMNVDLTGVNLNVIHYTPVSNLLEDGDFATEAASRLQAHRIALLNPVRAADIRKSKNWLHGLEPAPSPVLTN